MHDHSQLEHDYKAAEPDGVREQGLSIRGEHFRSRFVILSAGDRSSAYRICADGYAPAASQTVALAKALISPSV